MLETLLVNTFVFSSLLLFFVTIVFVIAQIKKDNSVMDIAYGPLFFVTALSTLFTVEGTSATAFLITGLIGLWSIRLSLRIYRKNKGHSEDARYAKWRSEWMKKGYLYFLGRSYVQINLLQGVVITIVAMPFLVATTASVAPYFFLNILGLLIYIFGLSYEVIADMQLDNFIKNKKEGLESSPIMKNGLFKYSRRPNYFGEVLVWTGLAVISLSLPFGFIAVISPILIGYIVTKVTGPMLEKIFLEKYPNEYTEYMNTTPYIAPDFKKILSSLSTSIATIKHH